MPMAVKCAVVSRWTCRKRRRRNSPCIREDLWCLTHLGSKAPCIREDLWCRMRTRCPTNPSGDLVWRLTRPGRSVLTTPRRPPNRNASLGEWPRRGRGSAARPSARAWLRCCCRWGQRLNCAGPLSVAAVCRLPLACTPLLLLFPRSGPRPPRGSARTRPCAVGPVPKP